MVSRLVQLLGPWRAERQVAATLADRVRSLILDGRLVVGERLPSERVLAAELHRSRSTVTSAYDRLQRSGFVERVHGGGTHVTLPHQGERPVSAVGERPVIDFTIASTGSAPGLHDATVRALGRLAELRGTSGYSLTGLDELRERVAARFRERGVPTDTDEIIITSGAMHALALVIAAFGRSGGTALVEQPTFPHALDALRLSGHRLLPTPVTPDGWDVAHLTDTLLRTRPRLAYLVPDFHNPTGATLSDDDRRVVVATARSAGTLLIDDETCTELDIDRGWTPTPLAALGDVITIGSLSKVAWGGLRVGWIRASRERITRILSRRPTIDLGTAPLEQCIAMELFDDHDALRRHVRDRLRAGREAVRAGIDALPGVTMPPAPGGLAVWVDLGAPVSTALSLAAQDRGLRLPAGPRFAATAVFERFLRVPITLEPEITADGMARLADAWDDVRSGIIPDAAYVPATVV